MHHVLLCFCAAHSGPAHREAPKGCIAWCKHSAKSWTAKCKFHNACMRCAPCQKLPAKGGSAGTAAKAAETLPACKASCKERAIDGSVPWAQSCKERACGACAPCQNKGIKAPTCKAACKKDATAPGGRWESECTKSDCQKCTPCQKFPKAAPRCKSSCKATATSGGGSWSGQCKHIDCEGCVPCKQATDSPACPADCKDILETWDKKCNWKRCKVCNHCKGRPQQSVPQPAKAKAAVAHDHDGWDDTPIVTNNKPGCSLWCMGKAADKHTWPEKCKRMPMCMKCQKCTTAAKPTCQGWCAESALSWHDKCTNNLCKLCDECSQQMEWDVDRTVHAPGRKNVCEQTFCNQLKTTERLNSKADWIEKCRKYTHKQARVPYVLTPCHTRLKWDSATHTTLLHTMLFPCMCTCR